jgi:hypothetical protein
MPPKEKSGRVAPSAVLDLSFVPPESIISDKGFRPVPLENEDGAEDENKAGGLLAGKIKFGRGRGPGLATREGCGSTMIGDGRPLASIV